eukprot:scaffold373_cov61-Cylindrotheca_fusiformis.AAC.1
MLFIITIDDCGKYSEDIIWDRSNFRSSNDGSATINHRKSQASHLDGPVLWKKDGLTLTNVIHLNYRRLRKVFRGHRLG